VEGGTDLGAVDKEPKVQLPHIAIQVAERVGVILQGGGLELGVVLVWFSLIGCC